MLDRAKLLRELEVISGRLFLDISAEICQARSSWSLLSTQDSFGCMVKQAEFCLPLPTWSGPLSCSSPVGHVCEESRTLVAADGSQIYPDRHQGASCFLINVGLAIISYAVPSGPYVHFSSDPHVFVGDLEHGKHGSVIDFVNCKREELELACGVNKVIDLQKAGLFGKLVLMLDGSLIFWHLEAKDLGARLTFLSNYCSHLQKLDGERILYAGYISCPKNKELVNLIRFAASQGLVAGIDGDGIDHLLDVHIAGFFLSPYTRTTVFEHRGNLSVYYPADMRPHFFYLHVGSEIVRVELPAWVAQDEVLVNELATIILDNSLKGAGYPIILAEAHEQAVVKGPDREFFYHLIQKIGSDTHRHIYMSQKSIKKRAMGV